MHARCRADLLALRGDARVAQHPGTPTLAHPFSGGLGLPIGISDVDVAPKADHIAKVQFVEEGEKLLIAKTSTIRIGVQYGPHILQHLAMPLG
jgi:hypothetical protein